MLKLIQTETMLPLSPWNVARWSGTFFRKLLVGVELEFAPPSGVETKAARQELARRLEASGNYLEPGPLGVFDVQKEHCGLEVRMVGREPHFDSLVAQYGKVVRHILEMELRILGTTGMHHHLILTRTASPLPCIILANLYSLTRAFAPYLRYMTSSGPGRGNLTRTRKNTSHLGFAGTCPCSLGMPEIQEKFRTDRNIPEHQNFFNLEHVRFGGGGVKRFHVEMRFPEMDMSPSSIAAKQMLMLALALKAVEVSGYGLLDCCADEEQWERTRELLDLLGNTDGKYAYSDTSGVTDEVICELRAGSRKLLALLSGQLENLDPWARQVLYKLAEKPVSLMRCEGLDWRAIEEDLSPYLFSGWSFRFETRLMRLIDMVELCGQASERQWLQSAAALLKTRQSRVKSVLDTMRRRKRIQWDETVGAPIRLGSSIGQLGGGEEEQERGGKWLKIETCSN